MHQRTALARPQHTCQQTVTGITSSTVTSIPAVRDWIAAVLTTQWHPTATSEPIFVRAAEIAGTKWGFTDANQVGWAQAARAASAMCYNRGFAGGHFTGHQLNGNYGLFCYKDGAQWFDATDAEIAATGFGFATSELDDVPWAQAARAAVGFCRGKGFSGGFMNGQFVPGRQGLVCQ